MVLVLNKIFSQFSPISFFFIPLTLVGGMLAIIWILFVKNSHWIESRFSVLSLGLKSVFLNLIGLQESNKKSWSIWIFSVFLFCVSLNFMSLIPYTFSQTSHLSFTFGLSIPIWVAFKLNGFQFNWRYKLSHLLPQGTPVFLVPLMMVIETMSLFMQPMTLGFRLGANLLAGHLLIFLCSCTIWELIGASYLGILSFVLMIALLVLEVAVAFIQAAVFLILSKKYLESKLK